VERAENRAEFEAFTKAQRNSSWHTNTLTEPSRCGNTNTANNAGPSTSTRTTLPKLTDNERKLLYNNKGCLKCRHVFVTHKANNCPVHFPNATLYKTVTQATVDHFKQRIKKLAAAITAADTSIDENRPPNDAKVTVIQATP
jgi:hypothetical protein